jgi:hypothetical protein
MKVPIFVSLMVFILLFCAHLEAVLYNSALICEICGLSWLFYFNPLDMGRC